MEIFNFINGKKSTGYSGRFETKTAFFDKKYTLPNSSIVDVGFALSAARKAHTATSALPFSQRKSILLKASEFTPTSEHEEFVACSTGMPIKHVRQRFETGKHLMKTLAEIFEDKYGVLNDNLIKPVYHKNKITGHELLVTREGPASVFLPPNDPAEPFFVFSHAVLSGQTLVVKPSQAEPLTSSLLAEAITSAGYPAGAINVVHWNTADETRKQLGNYLCKETPLRIMMGSIEAAQAVLQGTENTITGRTIHYCAGHTASLVLEDADIENTAQQLAKSAYEWTIDCVSTKTVIVEGKETTKKLVEALTSVLSTKKTGSPTDKETDIGFVPEQTANALDEILRGQQAFGAVHHHLPYKKLSAVQFSPVLCEAVSLNFPLLKQESPYTLVLYTCKDKEEIAQALETLREHLPTRKRMGIGIYTSRQIEQIMPLINKCHAHLVFFNTPTINLNFALNHQDVFLSDELMTPVSITSL